MIRRQPFRDAAPRLRPRPVAIGVALAVLTLGACSGDAGPGEPSAAGNVVSVATESDDTTPSVGGRPALVPSIDAVAGTVPHRREDALDAATRDARGLFGTERMRTPAAAPAALTNPAAPAELVRADVPDESRVPPPVSAEALTRYLADESSILIRPDADTFAPSVAAENRERYQALDDTPTVRTAEQSVSTFSIDVDTGSYSNVRRFLASGMLPPKDAVRLEELVNYFDYDYPVPDGTDVPFAASTELAPTPWNADTRLLRVGLKAYEPAPDARPAANLVFLVDVSGSMASPDKLGLLKTSLNLLAGSLTGEDRVGIVVYAGASGVVLEPVAGDDTRAISRALERLAAGGSTNGEAGIESAYRLADEHFIDGGVNRVILATDGDFNVGADGVDELVALVGKRRASGIALTTLGFGTGNYDDHLMERLADAGDGAYAYIDTLDEARKVLVEELDATLLTVARDVKVQLEFNPAVVAEYRLLGYANRRLANEDFADDRVDAGEIGAGHSVTALYEIALHGEGGERHGTTRYADAPPADKTDGEVAVLRLRYKRSDEDRSRSLETIVHRRDAAGTLDDASGDFRFAAAVAAFGQSLRGDTRLAGFALEDAADLAAGATGEDRFGYRAAFVRLARLAASLRAVDDPLTRRHDVDERG